MISTQIRAWVATLFLTAAVVAPGTLFAQAPRTSFLVNIDSQPQGATVRLDSETANPLGSTPLQRVRLPRGNHTLFFSRDGYIPAQLPVNVTRPRDSFSATLTQGGSIYVSADVDGAQVFLDGNAVGTTPGRINNVTPGQHVIEVRQSGMVPFRDTITVGAGAVASINASIRPPPPSPPPTGVVHVIVSNPNGPNPADLSVTFDGTPITGSPPSVDNAQPGTHIVQVSASGFRTIRREVQVTAGQTYALAVDLDAIVTAPTGGSVRVITVTTGAQVYLDGEVISAANGPAVRENVPPGTHALRVSATNRTTVTREIVVTAGQATVVEIPDLAQVAQVGRVAIRSPTPNSTVFIDGRNVGSSPYERDDMPAGTYNVTIRAQGFDDRSDTCTVSTTEACELNLPLSQTIGRANVHVELAIPRAGATLLVDNNALGEIGAGRDVPNVTAAQHEIRVRAEGYEDYVENVTLAAGEQHRTIVTLRRAHTGPSGADLAARRRAISTWGASPLARGDVAVDVMASLFDFPVQLRAAVGLVAFGPVGIDIGAGYRGAGLFNEIELRMRGGVRVLDGLIAVGAELRGLGGFGSSGQSNFGLSGWLIGSLHSSAPGSDNEAETDDPNERANRAGSFAFSLRFGFEVFSDGLNGMVSHYHGANGRFPVQACDSAMAQATSGSMGTDNPCNLTLMPATYNASTATNDQMILTGNQLLVRGVAAVMIEIGVSRHVNFFLGVDKVLASSQSLGSQRGYYGALWGGVVSGDLLFYAHLGLTYKF